MLRGDDEGGQSAPRKGRRGGRRGRRLKAAPGRLVSTPEAGDFSAPSRAISRRTIPRRFFPRCSGGCTTSNRALSPRPPRRGSRARRDLEEGGAARFRPSRPSPPFSAQMPARRDLEEGGEAGGEVVVVDVGVRDLLQQRVQRVLHLPFASIPQLAPTRPISSSSNSKSVLHPPRADTPRPASRGCSVGRSLPRQRVPPDERRAAVSRPTQPDNCIRRSWAEHVASAPLLPRLGRLGRQADPLKRGGRGRGGQVGTCSLRLRAAASAAAFSASISTVAEMKLSMSTATVT